MLQQAVFMAWHGMAWHGCCTCELTAPVVFYIKTHTKSNQLTFQMGGQWQLHGIPLAEGLLAVLGS